jgi:hypothetical protein
VVLERLANIWSYITDDRKDAVVATAKPPIPLNVPLPTVPTLLGFVALIEQMNRYTKESRFLPFSLLAERIYEVYSVKIVTQPTTDAAFE